MSLHYSDEWLTVYHGDARAVMAEMEPESVNCVVTSPPYLGLRDYGIPPTTWGGDPAHAHEWGEMIVDNATNHTDKRRWQHTRNGRDEEQPPEKRVAWRRTDVMQGAYCPCGAWCGSLGLEPTLEQYVADLVALFREVRRVLRDEGTVWLNLGDSYSAGGRGNYDVVSDNKGNGASRGLDRPTLAGFKPKDRLMVPARVAIALQADGWWLRDEIVWHKPNPMPSSVQDRTTPAHEMVYLLTKSARYWYDAAAIAETAGATNDHDATGSGYAAPGQTPQRGNRRQSPSALSFDRETKEADVPGQTTRQHRKGRTKVPGGWDIEPGAHGTVHRKGRTAATYRDKQAATPAPGNSHHVVGLNDRWDASEDAGAAPLTRNKRSVWTVATQPYPQAHFATFPEKLIEPMLKAGCPEGGVVLDPFAGSGTVGLVAQRLSRRAVLIDLSMDYLGQLMDRNRDIPLGLVV